MRAAIKNFNFKFYAWRFLIITLSFLYDDCIDRPNLTEQKTHLSI